MRKSVMLASVVLLVAAGAGGWLLLRPPASVDPPVAPDDRIAIDPQVAQVVQTVLNEARKSPTSGGIRMKLAMTYHANGLTDLAEQTYRHTLELDSRSARPWYQLARLLADRGEMDEAIVCIDQSIALDGTHIPSHWRRGLWLLDVNRIDEAKQSFDAASALDPQDAAARVGQARVALVHDQAAEAAAILEQFLARVPPPPNAAYVRQLLGMAYRQLGRFGGARSALALADGTGVTWPDSWAAELQPLRVGFAATIENATNLIAAGRSSEAIKPLTDLLRSKPGDITALNLLAQAHMASGQLEQGIDILRQGLIHAPNHAPTLINLSLAFEQKQQMDQALVHARSAVSAQPTLGPAHLQLGRLLVLSNNLDAANAELTSAVRLGVSDPQVRIMLASVMLEQKLWDDAAHTLEQALTAAPDSAAGHVALARARMETGSFDDAKLLLDRARQLDPNEQTLRAAENRLAQLQR
jgi:tetratricopeptide (TPR) repeat protein